jgi:hypothetical protein
MSVSHHPSQPGSQGIVSESLFMIELDQTSRRIGTTETTETIEETEAGSQGHSQRVSVHDRIGPNLTQNWDNRDNRDNRGNRGAQGG